jgi:hypothetical protein
MTSANYDMIRRVSGTALGPDLGMIGFLANTIHKRLTIGTAAPRRGHTHMHARMYATDSERSFDRLSGVVHLHHWPREPMRQGQ